ncbi:MAG: flagellar filament capping protein FliD [Phycisphaerales bacterium]
MSITAGIGLISGIDTATLIDQLISLQSIPKVTLQLRLAKLQTQQSALLDINARLLNLKTTSAGLRTAKLFQSITTPSSDDSVLTASPVIGGAAQPGSYSFLVKQLVSTSQKISRGFTDTNTSPVGLTQLSFELGQGFVSNDTALADLNAGAGVARGKITITDTDDNTATIDLTTATTVGEVLAAINSAADVKVTASVDGDRLVVTDTAFGVGGPLTIENEGTYTTATDLGIDVPAVGNVVTGNNIRTLGGVTPLSSLNDGTGVLLVSANPDITIHLAGGRQFDIDFGRIDTFITDDTLIEDLNNGTGIKTNPDSEEDIKFVDRLGNEHLVDLTGIVTVADLRARVDDQTNGAITIDLDLVFGNKLIVSDHTSPTGLLKVLGAGPLDEQTAEDLGILNVAGVDAASFDGTLIPNADHSPAATTIQQIIDRINSAKDIVDADNAGELVARLAADGVSLELEDVAAGGPPGLFRVESTAGNPSAARDLGLEGVAPLAGIIDGNRLIAGINSVLLRSLNGGTGVRDTTTLDITDREGTPDTFTIDPDGSLSDIVALINASAIKVTASINDAGNGLLITDTSGSVASALIIVGDPAIDLGIDTGGGGVDENTVRGDDLELRYVSNATQLSQLNYGRGIGNGTFRITDGDGDQVIIDIDTQKTVFELLQEINGQAGAFDVDIIARVNDNGDGIVLENTLMPVPAGLIKVESISGTTAGDLRLEGQATTEGGSIDGSYEATITLNASDTITEVLQAINDAGIPVNATVLNTGVGATPFKMVFSSEVSGTGGELLIDDGGFGLNLATLSEAQDAKVFFGSSDPTKATLIQRSSNTLTDVLQGVTVDLVSASDSPVSVNISRDTETIEDKIGEFVAAFNDAIQRIDQYDFFDVQNERRGPLLGNSTTAQVRGALIRVAQGKADGVQTQFQFLSQVGIRIGAKSTMTFDRTRFQDALEEDYDAVVNLFTAFESSTTTTRQIEEGVTVTVNDQTFAKLGFADLFDQLLDGLTNSIDGTVTIADQSLQSKIDLTNSRIEDFDERLDAKRLVLERQFTAMEVALAGLQAQQNGLLSLINNLALSQRALS